MYNAYILQSAVAQFEENKYSSSMYLLLEYNFEKKAGIVLVFLLSLSLFYLIFRNSPPLHLLVISVYDRWKAQR